VEAIRKYYDSVDGGLDNLRSSLVQEKTLSLLLSRAKKSYNSSPDEQVMDAGPWVRRPVVLSGRRAMKEQECH